MSRNLRVILFQKVVFALYRETHCVQNNIVFERKNGVSFLTLTSTGFFILSPGPFTHGNALQIFLSEFETLQDAMRIPKASRAHLSWKVRYRTLLRFFSQMIKLYRARSLLYRRQILQENIRWKALDEIYKIYMLLHRSDLKSKN